MNTKETPTTSSLQLAQLKTNQQHEQTTLTTTSEQQNEMITNKNDTTNKYIHQIDLLTPEFVSKLPDEDKIILNKILENEKKSFPNELPFTVVQHKNKQKQHETEIIFEKSTKSTSNVSMNENIDDYIKYDSTTPPKDRHFKPPFSFVPDYTFGTTIHQTSIEIDTPQFQATTTKTNLTSLRSNGGRGRSLTYISGRGRGGGYTGHTSRTTNQPKNNTFEIKDNSLADNKNIKYTNSNNININKTIINTTNINNNQSKSIHLSTTNRTYDDKNLTNTHSNQNIDKNTEMEETSDINNYDNDTLYQTLQSTRMLKFGFLFS
jgi:hypothetical protein